MHRFNHVYRTSYKSKLIYCLRAYLLHCAMCISITLSINIFMHRNMLPIDHNGENVAKTCNCSSKNEIMTNPYMFQKYVNT